MWTPHPRPLLVPDDGADSPLFAAIDESDSVQATLLFRAPLDEDMLDSAEVAMLSWFATARWGGGMPELTHETLTTSCLHVAVTGVASARDALTALLLGMRRARVPVQRAIFARVRPDGDCAALVRSLDPEAAPQARYDDPESWWRACFDAGLAPPLSEDRADLARDDDSILEEAQTTFVERRVLPLHVSGLRICYGLAEATFVSELTEEEDARSRAAARVLQTSLDTRFGLGDPRPRPVPYNRHLQPDAMLDRIRLGGRLGYSFALGAGDLREFLHEPHYRYREHELMLAVRDTARALELEPVVCWRRMGGRYVLQLWERDGSRVHAAA